MRVNSQGKKRGWGIILRDKGSGSRGGNDFVPAHVAKWQGKKSRPLQVRGSQKT